MHNHVSFREASEWMTQNSLKINEDKSEFIILSNKLNNKNCHSLTVGHNLWNW